MHPANETLFGTLRICYFSVSLDAAMIAWCTKNHKRLAHPPLFFYSTPNLKKNYPTALAILEEYRKEKQYSSKELKQHIVKRITNHGTCHGECVAILEQLLKNPAHQPHKLLQSVDVARIMYFQTIEHIRANSPCLQEVCWQHFLSLQGRKEINCTELKNAWDEFTKNQNQALIIRFVDSDQNFSHSMLYVITENSFWFYDPRLVGLYIYKSPAKLFDAFSTHLKAFFPKSLHSKTTLFIEIYDLPRFSQKALQGTIG